MQTIIKIFLMGLLASIIAGCDDPAFFGGGGNGYPIVTNGNQHAHYHNSYRRNMPIVTNNYSYSPRYRSEPSRNLPIVTGQQSVSPYSNQSRDKLPIVTGPLSGESYLSKQHEQNFPVVTNNPPVNATISHQEQRKQLPVVIGNQTTHESQLGSEENHSATGTNKQLPIVTDNHDTHGHQIGHNDHSPIVH